jgi:hypothetical protein
VSSLNLTGVEKSTEILKESLRKVSNRRNACWQIDTKPPTSLRTMEVVIMPPLPCCPPRGRDDEAGIVPSWIILLVFKLLRRLDHPVIPDELTLTLYGCTVTEAS